MKRLKSMLHNWLPPVIMRWMIEVKGEDNAFEGGFSTWQDADVKSTGYDAEKILEKVLAATLKVKNGEAVYERDSVIFNHVEYSWPVTAALMWVAARNNGRLSVLDFGGSLGSSYFQNRRFLESLCDINWNVVEQSHYVEAGRKFIESDVLKFYHTIDEYKAEKQPNVILLSSVLQYLEDPMYVIKKLSALKATCLIIDRTPFSNLHDDKILIQKVPDTIYSASYPMRVFSISKFLKMLSSNWELISDYSNQEESVYAADGVEFAFKGMLWELKIDK